MKGKSLSVTTAGTLGCLILLATAVAPAAAYPRPRTIEMVSVRSDGTQAPLLGNPSCTAIDPSSITNDGRYVAFESTAQLASGDNNASPDVYLRDRRTKQTELISVSSLGLPATPLPPVPGPVCGPMGSYGPEVTPNGRFVAFSSDAPILVPGDTNNTSDVFVRNRRTGETERVSIGPGGREANSHSFGNVSISDDGRFIVFQSFAGNLTEEPLECPGFLGTDLLGAGQCNHGSIFVHDRMSHKTELVSVGLDGRAGNGHSSDPYLSGNGRYVVFGSVSDNLTANDNSSCPRLLFPTSTCPDVFVFDRKTKTTEMVSVTHEGAPGNANSDVMDSMAPVSRNGQFVTFDSNAWDLVPNDPSGTDTFVRNMKTGRTYRVSVSSAGEMVMNGVWASISLDGRFVAFAGRSTDSQIGCSDSPCTGNWIHDRKTGATEPVDVRPESSGVVNHMFAGTSADGRHVVFTSDAKDLVPKDDNDSWDVFVVFRGPALSVGELVASGRARRLDLDGAPHFARTGTAWIADATSDAAASKLGAAGELLGARLTYRPLLEDLFVVLELDSMPRTPALAAVTAGSVYGMSFALDGRAYEIRAASTGLGPDGETTADFGLFSCADDGLFCTKVADLKGGFGTTGERITFSVPLADLGTEDESTISAVNAFTAVGTYLGGSRAILDDAGY